MSRERAAALIAAGGTGERFGRDTGKQLVVVAGRPVLGHAVAAFAQASSIGMIVLVCHPARVEEYASAVAPFSGDTPLTVVAGGATRQDSVAAGLAEIDDSWSVVAVHDGARPLITAEIIDNMVSALSADPDLDGLILGHPAYDTLKEVEGDRIVATPDRARYWAVQTPQVFRVASLKSAHTSADFDGPPATDDAALVEATGGVLRVIEGPRDNIKVTVAEDLAIAEALLRFKGTV